MGKAKNLTEKEKEYIKVHLLDKSLTEIANDLGRHYYTVFNWAKKFGRNNIHKFTAQEDTIIRMTYGKRPAKEIASKLHVSVEQLYNRARSLGVKKFEHKAKKPGGASS